MNIINDKLFLLIIIIINKKLLMKWFMEDTVSCTIQYVLRPVAREGAFGAWAPPPPMQSLATGLVLFILIMLLHVMNY